MLGTIVLLLVLGAVIYLLYVNDKLNTNSLNDSSAQSNSGDSVQFTPDGKANVRLGTTKYKNVRISHGDNKFSKVSVTEAPVRMENLIEHGDKLDGNVVFLGVLESQLNGATNKSTANFAVKKFKNLFVVFKGVGYTEIDTSTYMVRYDANGMVYALIDASNATIPELLKDVSYPIVVLTNNSSAQLVLKEWGYTQINDSATLFVKNEKSFRIQ
ncbi:occlusion derived virus envelope 25 [Epinotia aporema granulovirus]|uniref:Occlusion derived virus envelope 25 n=1 Tax=Epinotia aporema granulovirus TaxID=166056 RepID=K4EQ28_9BBAC|nr:occlusion derived virus envelope 25 [Epinotia aporema granulovirus]AER41512.1 occlusion derived virus envelope 25 [Epinotia aporema granulovirus]